MSPAVTKSQFASDLKEKDTVATAFLVKFSALATDKNGKPYMNLVLMDRTGEIEARIWDNVPSYMGQAVRDALVWVEGRCQAFQNRRQVVIKDLRVLREDEVALDQFVPEGTLDPEHLYKKLLSYVDSMTDPEYRALAQAVVRDDADVADRIKRAPAAKSVHHAYRGGLIEHVVSILGILDTLAQHYSLSGKKILDRDLLFLGGILHDIGKLWELSYERTVDYTDEGRLVGHLVMGVELVERKIREMTEPFSEDKKLLVKHVILAHHGRLEYGSPKEPQCLEALVVHMIDDLDSKVGAISQFISQDPNPGHWTGLHKMYGRFFYKPDWALKEPQP